MHQPWTAAIVGVRQSATALIAFCMRSISVWKSVRGRASAPSAINGANIPPMAGTSRP
ncbi:Uncharacterised protein [Mycobacterium tuberculosis]|nr:Uncharacterised protein [Mycobacterium tuberculosis]